ncbi:putative baseplate assembly protein [Streptomyces albiflavescens]|uniref:Baseplate assembly protein n=1 Tax=Streptomyces albiflavescens TaxID=1623582 RepID=A0A917YEJ4_9ACTN|nr:putative baseplate assembly protein [Streptomyces albiflavescens]GGN94515.1 putative baseplate assembly protein [Streptomyces albiflavescens]
MVLSLPQLDDRRWADLVEEARSLIPVYAPEWTDHNASDPGITFVELLAWITEMEIFQLDQIPERHRRAFLALAGITPRRPRPARTVLEVALRAGSGPVTFPASVEFGGRDPHGRPVRLRTLDPLHATVAQLAALRREDRDGPADLTEGLRRGTTVAPFGPDPRRGDRILLEFDAAVPPSTPVSIVATPELPQCDGPLEHHGARTHWEIATASGGWRLLSADEVTDTTRCFTRTGMVVVSARTGFSRLSCRLVRAGYDQAPMLSGFAVNAAVAEQSVPVGEVRWDLAPGAAVPAAVTRGRTVRLGVRLDAQGRITAWDTEVASAPAVLVLDRRPHQVTLEAADLGHATGAPEQTYLVSEEPAEISGLWTLEPASDQHTWRQWRIRPTLDASGPADPHALLDAATGRITFGDGERGRVPPAGARVIAVARTTAAQAGNIAAGRVTALAASPHNRALLTDASIDPNAVSRATNSLSAEGGSAAETLAAAEVRAARLSEHTLRAVTLADHERLALLTPGVRLARAVARANSHPAFPCVVAPGVVWVTVVPYLPLGRPMPGPGLLAAVRAHLHAHRILGTRVEVTGPSYQRITVRAQVRPRPGADPAVLRTQVARALDAFFDPLTGGPDGDGWPLGRDVYRSEILQVLDGVPGVAHATGLELLTDSGAHCANVCIPPNGLVGSGPHEIEAV